MTCPSPLVMAMAAASQGEIQQGSWAQRNEGPREASSAGSTGRASRGLGWACGVAWSAGKSDVAQHSLQSHPPERRASGQGTWRPVTAHMEGLQIHGGSSIKAGASATAVPCSCRQGCSGAGEEQAVKRDSPSRAAGSSPDPTDGYGGAVTSRFSHELRRAQRHTLLCKTALCPTGVLVGFGEGRSPAEGHTSQGNVACCRRRRARTECGPWLMRGVWGFPSLGRCVAVAVL